jgi:predicted ATPase/class 3 adenylate cyclase
VRSGMNMANDLPTGDVTFLFSDIEGSTRLLGQLGERYPAVLETHQDLLRKAFATGEGLEILTEGDSFFCVFRDAHRAVAAAVEAQRALAAEPWPEGVTVRVRMGLHTGQGVLGGDSYVGMDVHRAARIAAAGHGGQVLISEATKGLVQHALPEGASLRDLGDHRLKDLAHPERLFQIVVEELPSEFPPVRSLDARPGNLPHQLTSFVGRRREIDEVKERLTDDTRLLTLTGPGGTGKTRLSIQVASELLRGFGDGAFFVALAPISDAELVMSTIAKTLGLQEQATQPMIETLTEHLQDKRLLLVLDNFEQVLDAAPGVGELLARSPELKVLATSREALGLHGEKEYPVPPLGLPDPEHLPSTEALSQFEAVALFIDRATAVKPGFEVTNDNAPAIAEICARLDGLPLAIELAAARIKVLAPAAILKRLGHSLSLLAGGARDLPTRQQTLRGAIDWSYELLEEQERMLFARLSVFVGGFSLEAAEAVCNPDGDLAVDTLEGVASLTNKSLVRQMDSPGGESRFFMLETIREYASERLAQSPDVERIGASHARFFLAMAERAEPALLGSEQALWLDSLEQEHDNLRAAITWASHGDVETALLLCGALWRFWQIRGHLREAAMRFRNVLDVPASAEYPTARAKALEGGGGVAYWMADWDVAGKYYGECVELRKELGDTPGLAEALYNLSFVYALPPPPRRDLERSLGLNAEALKLYQEVGDRRGEAKVLWQISNSHLVRNEWKQCLENAQKSLEIFREFDDRFSSGWALHSIGIAWIGLGDLDEARKALSESLGLFKAAGDLTGIAILVNDFAILALLRDDLDRAVRLHAAALETERKVGQGLVSNYHGYVPWDPRSSRERLGDEAYEKFFAEGGAMSVDEAVSYALATS